MIGKTRISALMVAALLLAVSTSTARAAVITAGNHEVLPDSIVHLPVLVSGGMEVNAMNLRVQIADGGSEVGGSIPGPAITGVDYTGSVWDGIAGFDPTGDIAPAVPQVYAALAEITTANTATLDGILVTLIVDTTGFNVGDSFVLRLGDDGGLPWVNVAGDTDFVIGVQGAQASAIHAGTITIVPEPASLALMGAGALLLIRRRRG